MQYRLKVRGQELTLSQRKGALHCAEVDWRAEMAAAQLTGSNLTWPALFCSVLEAEIAGGASLSDLLSGFRAARSQASTVWGIAASWDPLVLTVAAGEDSESALAAVAGNQYAPPAVLVWMYQEYPDLAEVRHCLAGNPSTPPPVLAKLTHYASRLAQNPAVSLELLQPLLPGVAKENLYGSPLWKRDSLTHAIDAGYAKRPETTWAVVPELGSENVHRVLANPKVTDEMRMRAAGRDDMLMRVAMIQDPRSGPKELEAALKGAKLPVRVALACNPRINERTARKLAFDPEPAVRMAAAANPVVSDEIRRAMLRDWHSGVREVAGRELERKQLGVEL